MTNTYEPKIDPEGDFAYDFGQTLRALGQIVGEVNVNNGWDTSRSMVEDSESYDPQWQSTHKIAELGLITTEVAEAIEEVRHGHAMNETYYVTPPVPTSFAVEFSSGAEATEAWGEHWHEFTGPRKPEGVPSELADALIRILDIADAYKIDIGAAVIEKLNHNATRGLRHGGKAL